MSQYLIEEDGSTFKLEKTPIEITPSIERAFQASATIKLKGVADFSEIGLPMYGRASLTHTTSNSNITYWSVRVCILNLNTTFALNAGVMTPTFQKEGQFIEIPWRPIHTMTVVLGLMVLGSESDGFKLSKHYLVAYDNRNTAWRLPLPNLYDHLELCHGQPSELHPTMFQALVQGLKGFAASPWNSDLMGSFQNTNAHLMFRFKPVNTGFEQLPLVDAWTSYCQKVANPMVNSTLMPV